MKENIIPRLKSLLADLNKVDDSDDFDDWQSVALNTLENIFKNNVPASIEELEAYNEDEDEDYTDEVVASAKKILKGLIIDVEHGFGVKDPTKKSSPVHINNHVNQHSQQTTQIDIDLRVKQQVEIKLKFIIEAMKEELTGKQLKELQEIQESNDSPEIKKQRFFDKVKSFGADVATGMVSGIVANPDFFQQLTH